MSQPKPSGASTRGGPGTRGGSVLLGVVATALLLASVGAFCLSALERSLNFDESLALKAGWLLLSPYRGQPTFYMPVTLLLGAVAHAVSDPGLVLSLCRGAVLATLLPLLAWAGSKLQSRNQALLAGSLLFSQVAFIAHGLEFRYDWALLLGWVGGYALLAERRPPSFVAVGACAAWLAAHHAKGVFFGVLLLLLALAVILTSTGTPRRRSLLRLAAGCSGSALAWVLLAVACGAGRELVDSYVDFFTLGAEVPLKVWPWVALEQGLRADAVWWLSASLATLGIALRLALRRPAPWMDRATLMALPFGLLPLAFTFVHPHPWTYMLALPAPFFGIVMAAPLTHLLEQRRWLPSAAVAATVAGLWLQVGQTAPWDKYRHSLHHDRSSTVRTLRSLRALASPEDRVVDPTGMAYFLPPCTEQWYIDTLFREEARRGKWMRDLVPERLPECRWLIATYRAQWLAPRTVARLWRDYRYCPGGPRVHQSVATALGCLAPARLDADNIPSYW